MLPKYPQRFAIMKCCFVKNEIAAAGARSPLLAFTKMVSCLSELNSAQIFVAFLHSLLLSGQVLDNRLSDFEIRLRVVGCCQELKLGHHEPVIGSDNVK